MSDSGGGGQRLNNGGDHNHLADNDGGGGGGKCSSNDVMSMSMTAAAAADDDLEDPSGEVYTWVRGGRPHIPAWSGWGGSDPGANRRGAAAMSVSGPILHAQPADRAKTCTRVDS